MRLDQVKKLLLRFKVCPLCNVSPTIGGIYTRRKRNGQRDQWDFWLGPEQEENLVGPTDIDPKDWRLPMRTDQWLIMCHNESCRMEIRAVPNYKELGYTELRNLKERREARNASLGLNDTQDGDNPNHDHEILG